MKSILVLYGIAVQNTSGYPEAQCGTWESENDVRLRANGLEVRRPMSQVRWLSLYVSLEGKTKLGHDSWCEY